MTARVFETVVVVSLLSAVENNNLFKNVTQWVGDKFSDGPLIGNSGRTSSRRIRHLSRCAIDCNLPLIILNKQVFLSEFCRF